MIHFFFFFVFAWHISTFFGIFSTVFLEFGKQHIFLINKNLIFG